MLNASLLSLSNFIYRLTWNRVTPRYLLAALALFAIVLLGGLVLCRKKQLTLLQAIASSFLILYLFTLLGGTVICRNTRTDYSYILKPFWSYTARYISSGPRRGMILRNCFMLFPVGFLAPIALGKTRLSLGKLSALSLAISYTIEILQLVMRRGTFELVDDPLHNLIGAVAGFLLCQLLSILISRLKRQ